MALTNHLRQVWRTFNNGNRVLSVQQWYEAEGWENPELVEAGGQWEDVEISSPPDDQPPASWIVEKARG